MAPVIDDADTTRQLSIKLGLSNVAAAVAQEMAHDRLATPDERETARKHRIHVMANRRRFAEMLIKRGPEAAAFARPFLWGETE